MLESMSMRERAISALRRLVAEYPKTALQILALGLVLGDEQALAKPPFPFDDSRTSFVFPLPPTPRLVPVSDPVPFEAGNAQSLASVVDRGEIKYVSVSQLLDLIVSDGAQGTISEGKVNLHGLYDDGRLNVYFLGQAELEKVSDDIGICQYLPPHPLILCNAESHSFVLRHDNQPRRLC